MKKIYKKLLLLPLLALMTTLSGCTTNNGDIGPLLGLWKVTDIQYQNCAPAEEYEGRLFFAFQAQVVKLFFERGALEQEMTTYGSWRLEDNTLFLTFPQEDRPQYPEFILPRESRLQVIKMTSHDVILAYNPTLDATITFYLKKW